MPATWVIIITIIIMLSKPSKTWVTPQKALEFLKRTFKSTKWKEVVFTIYLEFNCNIYSSCVCPVVSYQLSTMSTSYQRSSEKKTKQQAGQRNFVWKGYQLTFFSCVWLVKQRWPPTQLFRIFSISSKF